MIFRFYRRKVCFEDSFSCLIFHSFGNLIVWATWNLRFSNLWDRFDKICATSTTHNVFVFLVAWEWTSALLSVTVRRTLNGKLFGGVVIFCSDVKWTKQGVGFPSAVDCHLRPIRPQFLNTEMQSSPVCELRSCTVLRKSQDQWTKRFALVHNDNTNNKLILLVHMK